MEWTDKVKMVNLGNKRDESEETKLEFQKFVLDNIDSFDSQAWDMFSNLVDLIIDDMKKDIEFWKQIYSKIKDLDTFYSNNNLDLRTSMRIAFIHTICEEIVSS